MRSVIVFVCGAVVAIVLAFLFSASRSGHSAQESGRGGVDEEQIASLQKSQGELRRELEQLKGAVEAIENCLTELGRQDEKTSPERKEPAGGAAPVGRQEADKRTAQKEPRDFKEGGEEDVRRIVREELKRVEEERKKKLAEKREAQKPEEWEKKEFGQYAWNVHYMGLKLGLTDEQKRQYYAITKETTERTKGLWQRLKNDNPETEAGRLSAIYQERVKEVLREQKESLRDILNDEQWKKYNEMYGSKGGDNW